MENSRHGRPVKRARPHALLVRMSDAEHAELTALARHYSVGVGEAVRRAVHAERERARDVSFAEDEPGEDGLV